MAPVKVQRPSISLTAANKKLSSMPVKRLPVEVVRAQVIQNLVEAKSEIPRSGHDLKRR
ncbi:MAG: hypothetical protein JWM59_540 [Verrucomicrobiales bacterium]|nr:hypothetical protein [Verrucomicrobiales bacterium]